MSLVYEDDWLTVHGGDCRSVMLSMKPGSVDCIITSPPYFNLRDYHLPPLIWDEAGPCIHRWGPLIPSRQKNNQHVGGSLGADKVGGGRATRSSTAGRLCTLCLAWEGQLGLEPNPWLFVRHLVQVFDAAWHVLKDSGTLWLNLGDSFATAAFVDPLSGERIKADDLIGIPWMAAFALREAGWYLRTDIVWSKPNGMPESPSDRPNRNHEFVFLLAKKRKYLYDVLANRETAATKLRTRREVGLDYAPESDGMRRQRDVWNIPTVAYPEEHYAVFPPDLVVPMVRAGCPREGIVLDPFAGSGTVGLVAQSLSRKAILIDMQPGDIVRQFKRAGQTPLGLEV